ncbi:hemolysin XhlA family protein [Bacillus cereus]|uniref:hemolysin XhlA family protein n=1 Tax=Bacillus cereus group TaxID=86661 RepID=UPI00283A8FAD|nr:hemolysin XhlA family protein [Bacillus cereus]MCU4989973.1 hemolysin XhlA family protein [Bacillus cereus]
MEKCRECEESKTKMQNVEIRLAVVESKVAKIEENIEKILNNTNWLVKSIVGGIIAAVLAFFLKGGGM